jgi:hypothetical protein
VGGHLTTLYSFRRQLGHNRPEQVGHGPMRRENMDPLVP